MPWAHLDKLNSTNLNAKSGLVFNVKDEDYGATGDGVTDDTAALQAAAAAALAAGGRLRFPGGTYATSGTVTIRCDCDADYTAVISYTGSGVAVDIGDDTNILIRKHIILPRVVMATQAWVPSVPTILTDTGVRVRYAYSCNIEVPHVQNFSYGLQLTGTHGVPYNRFAIGHLDNNAINLSLTPDVSGWANENQFHGGRYSHNSSGGTGVVGVRQIELLVGSSTHKPNNNLWLGGSVEGEVAEHELYCDGATYNTFLQLRWENRGGGGAVVFANDSVHNRIWGGYAAGAIDVTITGTGCGANMIDPSGSASRYDYSGFYGAAWRNQSSDAYPVHLILDTTTSIWGSDLTTAYSWAWGAQSLAGKRPGDAYDRITLDNVNGRIKFGTGSADAVGYLDVDANSIYVGGTRFAVGTSYAAANFSVAGLSQASGTGQSGMRCGGTYDATVATSFVHGFRALIGTQETAGTCAQLASFYGASPTLGSGSTVTKAYGLYLEDVDIGGTNYAVYTNAGAVHFGGAVDIALASVPTAANNAAAATAGVAVGGLYRTNADPSVVCIRSA